MEAILTFIDDVQTRSASFTKKGMSLSPDAGECYVSWYKAVEKSIEAFFEATGVTFDAGHDDITGRHRYHEAVLEELRKITNPFHDALGKGPVHEYLRAAKNFRNKAKSDPTSDGTPRGPTLTNCVRAVTRALWISFGIVDSHLKRGPPQEDLVERERMLDEEALQIQNERAEHNGQMGRVKQELELWKTAATKFDGQVMKLHGELRESNAAATERDEQVKELQGDLEESKAAASELERQYRFLQTLIGEDEGDDGSNGVPPPLAVRVKRIRREMLLRSIKKGAMLERVVEDLIVEQETSAYNAQFDAKTIKSLSSVLQECDAETKRLEHMHEVVTQTMESHLQHARKINGELKKQVSILDLEVSQSRHASQVLADSASKENQELKRNLSEAKDLANSRIDPKQHDNISRMILHHQQSRKLQQDLTIAKDKDLAELVQDLLASHIKAEVQVKLSKDNQATLQQHIEDLQTQLETSETQRVTDEELVMSLLIPSEGCENSKHRMLEHCLEKRKP
ncbi:hypothetical protein P7C71_g4128, partial [Lecanoromycetidae sp. Uapishka_2]